MIEIISFLNESNQSGLDLIVILKNAVPYVAYFGAIGALINAILQYKNYIKNKPVIEVDFDNRGYEFNPKTNTITVYISCMNKGDSAITISSFGFYIKNLRKYVELGPYLFDSYFRTHRDCTRLDPGCNISAWIETKDLEESLRTEKISLDSELFFFFRDGHKNAYNCHKPFYLPKLPK